MKHRPRKITLDLTLTDTETLVRLLRSLKMDPGVTQFAWRIPTWRQT